MSRGVGTGRLVACLVGALLFITGCGESSPTSSGDSTRSDDSQTAQREIDHTSLQSVANAWDEYTGVNGDADAAMELVDPSCRPESMRAELEQGVNMMRKMVTAVPPDKRAAATKEFRTVPRDVVYDGGDPARSSIASTPSNGATGAAVFSYPASGDTEQTIGVRRYILIGDQWWVDPRTGPSQGPSLAGRRTECPA